MKILNFNDTLTNDVVSFEQPGPGVPSCDLLILHGKADLSVSHERVTTF